MVKGKIVVFKIKNPVALLITTADFFKDMLGRSSVVTGKGAMDRAERAPIRTAPGGNDKTQGPLFVFIGFRSQIRKIRNRKFFDGTRGTEGIQEQTSVFFVPEPRTPSRPSPEYQALISSTKARSPSPRITQSTAGCLSIISGMAET